ncbi:MAG TPA: A/G-specific adenine glycosylase [Chitinophagaceae bacterium]|nr:A/G-specific adenine glycosylase [Chitinophagaceae bacterium]
MKAISGKKQAFTFKLMRWGKHNDRKMPWKGERDPYKIWLSEIILQQTRVEQGMPYYERFVERYPTVGDLAGASDQEVFRMWQGLGYYNRCKNMLKAAREVCKTYGGLFPDTYNRILELPGIGEYTASAIASFAYHLSHAVVDGNVQRVLARFFGIQEAVNSPAGKKHFATLAREVLDESDPAAYNQAIMDFGATVCTPQRPACGDCPLQKECFAKQHQLTGTLPVKIPKAKPRTRYFSYVVVCYRGKTSLETYLHKRDSGDIWQNLHEFTLCEDEKFSDEKALLTETPVGLWLKGNPVGSLKWSKTYRQQLTHQVINARFLRIDLQKPVSAGLRGDYFPVPADRLNEYAFPRIIVRYLQDAKLLK